MSKPINVLIVDDSAVVRQVLSEVINHAEDMTVIATASDPIFAMRQLEKSLPDVIVLDIEMPRMDGLTFLRQLMKDNPIPVVICSSLAEKGTSLAIAALEAGAVDIITKPQLGVKSFLVDATQKIRNVVKTAAEVNIRKFKPVDSTALSFEQSNKTVSDDIATTESLTAIAQTTDRITAIGCSTGGTLALECILADLPRTCPGIVIVQHMPEKFTRSFADRLNSLSRLEVREAESGDRIIPGRALIAPGGQHLEVVSSGAQYITRVFSGPAVNRHCPSVDVLFRSVAKHVGRNAKGVIMTGMGNDGAKGLLEMKQAGSMTIAQDEESSVVFGMPKEAIKIGAANKVVSLDNIAGMIST